MGKSNNSKSRIRIAENFSLPALQYCDKARKMSSPYSNFSLSTYWRSSSSWRVRTALAAKGITYDSIPVHLVKGEQKSEENMKVNHMAQVPTLHFTHKGKQVSLSQSLAIIDFLESAFPDVEGSLYPKDALDKANALEIAEIINSGTQPLQNFGVMKKITAELGDKAAEAGITMTGRTWAKDFIIVGLTAVERVVSRLNEGNSADEFYAVGGDHPTVADACIVPQLYNGRRFEVDLETVCPTLLKVEKMCQKNEWFIQSHPDAQVDAVVAEPAAKKAKA